MSWARGRRAVVGGVVVLVGIGLAAGPAVALSTPGTPESVHGTAGNPIARVSLGWSVPTDTGGGVSTYLYDVSTNYDSGTQTGTWSALVNLKRSMPSAAVPCAATYPAVCTYRVYARNAAGTSPPSAPLSVAWTAPGRARNVRSASTNFTDAAITWAAPADTGGLPDVYDVENSNDGGTTWTTLASNVSGTSYSAPGSCASGFVCKYRVWAKNAVGTSASASNVAQMRVTPGPARSLVVTHASDDPTTGNTNSGSASMSISWAAPLGGLHDGPYMLEECTGSCSVMAAGWSAPESVPNATLSVTRTCPAAAGTCTYRVQATNTRGGVSAWITSRYVPVAPALSSVVTGPTSGTVTATFTGATGTGPASVSAHFAFQVCSSGCDTATNWSASPTTVAYPPATSPTVADVACPVAAASCTVRALFVNDAGHTSMLSAALTATAG